MSKIRDTFEICKGEQSTENQTRVKGGVKGESNTDDSPARVNSFGARRQVLDSLLRVIYDSGLVFRE